MPKIKGPLTGEVNIWIPVVWLRAIVHLFGISVWVRTICQALTEFFTDISLDPHNSSKMNAVNCSLPWSKWRLRDIHGFSSNKACVFIPYLMVCYFSCVNTERLCPCLTFWFQKYRCITFILWRIWFLFLFPTLSTYFLHNLLIFLVLLT